MSIQYMAPGFKPTPLEHECPTITTRPGLPPKECSLSIKCKTRHIVPM